MNVNRKGVSYMEIIVGIVMLSLLSAAYFRLQKQSAMQSGLAARDSMLMHSCHNIMEKLLAADELPLSDGFMSAMEYDNRNPGIDLGLSNGEGILLKIKQSGDQVLIYVKTSRKPILYCTAKGLR